MDKIQLLKNKLTKSDLNTTPEIKKALICFAELYNNSDSSQEIFNQAILKANLNGPDSIKLSLRFQSERIIKKIFKEMGIIIDIDSITPILMANIQNDTNE